MTGEHMLRMALLFQLVVTVFLVLLFRFLYARFRRAAFFQAWTWAWISFAVFVAAGASLSFSQQPLWLSWHSALAAVAGFLQIAFLFLGAQAFRTQARISRRRYLATAGLAAALAVLAYGLSIALDDPALRYAIQAMPRQFGLVLVYGYCVFVFGEHWRRTRSAAALLTGLACVMIGVDQLLYVLADAPGELSRISAFLWHRFDPGSQAVLEWLMDVTGELGIALGMVLLFLDVHQKTAAEHQLQGQHLELALEATKAWSWEWDPGLDLLSSSRSTGGIYDERVPVGPLEVALRPVHDDDRERTRHLMRVAVDSGGSFDNIMRLRLAHEMRWIAFHGRCVGDGAARRLAGIAIDVTDSRRRLEELHEAESRLGMALNHAPVVLFAFDREGIFTCSEGRGLADLGLKPGEVVGRSLFEIYRDVPEILEHARRALAGEEFVATDRLPALGKEYLTKWACDLDAEGEIRGGLGVAMDVTERRELEAKFLQSQRMEAVGNLAAGVAHDFNNLLTIIQGYGEILYERRAADEADARAVRGIREAGERAATLVRQLLAFSRKQVLQPRVVDLNAVIHGLEKMLRRLIREDIQLVILPSEGLGDIQADVAQLEQVLMNLVINARDAMPRGGSIELQTSNVEFPSGMRADAASVPPGRYVLITVKDNGSGIEPTAINHIFEPFFTTKEPGHGTGLGLSMVYGFVKQSSGYIFVESEPDKGTTFSLYFPRIDRPQAVAAEQPEQRAEEHGRETILVVEDDPQVRLTVRDMLAARGYSVLVAGSCEEARRHCREASHAIDLLLTDVVLPGVDGPALAEEIRRECPRVRILFMSGYTERLIQDGFQLREGVSFLQKPFTPSRLSSAVREALSAGQGQET